MAPYFAGIGGLDLGLERTGWQCKWQVENDPYCIQVLQKHWPNIKRYGDIKTVTELEKVDLICGGFPCQPVSVAGKRKGTQDERWLWPEFARIIHLVRPRFVLVENVPGLLSLGMSEVLGDLAASGYDAEWNMLSASMFGAPHRRNRIFIVAYNDGGRLKKPYIPVRQSRQDQTPLESLRCGQISTANIRSERIQSIFKGQIQRQSAFSWCQDLRSIEDLRGRSDLPQPLIRRGDDGFSSKVDRLRCLGNAVVPQVAEWIGRRIMEVYR